MAITDRTAIENYMLIDIDPSFYDQIDEWIAGVEQEMNKLTDRQLIAVEPGEDEDMPEYLYDGTGKKVIMVDDFVEIETVKIDDEDITEDCYLYPANSIPKWKIESTRTFPRGRQNITVAGVKGFTTQDVFDTKYNDLKFAATVIMAGIINFSNNSAGEIKSESIGRYTVTYATDSSQKVDYDKALETIRHYRRMR